MSVSKSTSSCSRGNRRGGQRSKEPGKKNIEIWYRKLAAEAWLKLQRIVYWQLKMEGGNDWSKQDRVVLSLNHLGLWGRSVKEETISERWEMEYSLHNAGGKVEHTLLFVREKKLTMGVTNWRKWPKRRDIKEQLNAAVVAWVANWCKRNDENWGDKPQRNPTGTNRGYSLPWGMRASRRARGTL